MPAAFHPRIVATLVALRRGPRSIGALADAIGDASTRTTFDLLVKMEDEHALVVWSDATPPKVRLTRAGIDWLGAHDLRVDYDNMAPAVPA